MDKTVTKERKAMTQYYVGVKIVQAWEEEREGRHGYAVKYPDGYTSWSPKQAFESAYLPMGQDPSTVTSSMVDLFTGREYESSTIDEKTTLVKCDTLTGFRQYETSSCVDPKNYDPEIGSEICVDRIKDRIWKYLGFVVQWGRFGLNKNG